MLRELRDGTKEQEEEKTRGELNIWAELTAGHYQVLNPAGLDGGERYRHDLLGL